MVFTYFSIPENIRRSELASTQVSPVDRAVEEELTSGSEPGSSVVTIVDQNLELATEFFETVEKIAKNQPTDQDGFEFQVGSFLTLAPFISREKSSELEKLWGIDIQ